jgi:hypothetical protein
VRCVERIEAGQFILPDLRVFDTEATFKKLFHPDRIQRIGIHQMLVIVLSRHTMSACPSTKKEKALWVV